MRKFRGGIMKGSKRLLLIGLLVMGLFLTACSEEKAPEEKDNKVAETQEEKEEHKDDHDDHDDHDHDHDHDEDSDGPEDLELSDWDGEWNSVTAFMDEKEVHDELEKKAEEEGISLEEAIEEAKKGNAFPYEALKVDGDKITYYDGRIGEGSEKLEAEYSFKEAVAIEHAGRTMYWYAFETDAEGIDPYLILLPLHGEDTLAHWHARVGTDLDEMVNRESDIGTFIRPSAPIDLIADEIAE